MSSLSSRVSTALTSLTSLARSDRDSVSLWAALAASGAAAVLLAFGATMPVLSGADPGFGSGPLLVVLAVLPLGVALVCVLLGRASAGAGVLVGVAALAPGRAVMDLQFAVDASAATRPELYLATDLASPAPMAGLWLLLAGHVATGAAGVLANAAARNGAEGDQAADELTGWRQRWMLVAVGAGVVAAFGVLMAPIASDDVYLLARNAFEGPLVALAGYVLLAGAIPLVAALVMSSRGDSAFARGGLVGLATGVVCVTVPNLAAGLSLDTAGVSAGPVIALVGAAGLVAVAAVRSGDGAVASAEGSAENGDRAGEARVPGLRRLQAATGLLAVITAACAVAGASTAQLMPIAGLSAPESPSRWLLFAAGVGVGLLGLAMFVPRAAMLVRPVLSVLWAGVLLAGTAVLDTAIAADSLPVAISAGPGMLWTWLAMLAAVVTACCSVVTGFVERDDVGATGAPEGADTPALGLNMLVPLTATAVLAVVAFSTPVLTAPDYVVPGLWSHFGTPSWGLLAGVLAVLGALVLATRSRPLPAAGLLIGTAGVLGLHAAALPLSEIDGARAATGVWFALAAAVAALATAALVLSRAVRAVRR